ncbi:hypothetical protein PRZ48_000287 [Zasmidium cellare]|uniref:Phosphatidylglycerol/phosphatidylinositol transfer protein n=1 Tax=Zasmidium cellare TaxID=395010 RepID=A0ABR0EYM9_ZASCE|nr:hypothetical protein PRZ48_000287 [Zasmidium cellare]
MKFLSIFALAAGLTAVAADAGISGNAGLEYCKGDGKDSKLQLDEVNIEPANAIRGQSVRITAKGTSKKELHTGAEVVLKFKKGIIKKTFKKPICEGEGAIQCPSKNIDTSFSQFIPEKAPAGDWKVEIKVKDGKDELACFKTKIHVDKDPEKEKKGDKEDKEDKENDQ